MTEELTGLASHNSNTYYMLFEAKIMLAAHPFAYGLFVVRISYVRFARSLIHFSCLFLYLIPRNSSRTSYSPRKCGILSCIYSYTSYYSPYINMSSCQTNNPFYWLITSLSVHLPNYHPYAPYQLV